MSIADAQFNQLRERFAAATERKLVPSGTRLISIPDVPIDAGWNKASTSLRFLVPSNYPYAALDCFWADNDLRLANGSVPQAAQANNVIPEANENGLWFSWHLAHPWNPNRDSLTSWVNTIKDRLRRPQ